MDFAVDIELIRQTLIDRGHAIGHIIPTPANAGGYEFEVDGNLLSLDEARALLEADAAEAHNARL